MARYAIIILAGGSSSRLGKPKQLLEVNGTTLIEYIVNQAKALTNACTLVVTGAADLAIRSTLSLSDVRMYFNPDWELGMSESIKAGVREVLKLEPHINGCILMVCDQPYISTKLLEDMIALYESGSSEIVACTYGNTAGTPVLFGPAHFDELSNLRGHAGAKKIIAKYQTNTSYLPFPMGLIDIDTAEDYVTFISKNQ